MSKTRREGACLCGAVQVRLAVDLDEIGVCHCETCRTWGSGPWMALQVPGSEVVGERLIVYRSSTFAERGFCGACGTHIFHRPRDGSELALSAGLFDAGERRVAFEIFADRQPPWYRVETDGAKIGNARLALKWGPKLAWRRISRMFGLGSASGR